MDVNNTGGVLIRRMFYKRAARKQAGRSSRAFLQHAILAMMTLLPQWTEDEIFCKMRLHMI